MANIPYAEAMELGLIPRRLEDAISEYYASLGRYPSGFPRSMGGTLPFYRMPSPFQRPSSLSFRSGIAPLRFGLGPLALGLGLSPAAPAISGGGVPVGRRPPGGGGPADIQTLLARAQPQDIAAIRQLVDAGLLPASVLALLAGFQQGAPSPARPMPPRLPLEGPPRPPEALTLAQKGLGLAKLGQKVVGTGQKVLGQLGVLPPGSFAKSPEIEQAYQLYRAGERAPSGVPGIEAGALVPFALSPDIVSGVSGGAAAPAGFNLATATPFQLSPEILSGASGGGAVGGTAALPILFSLGWTPAEIAAVGGVEAALAASAPAIEALGAGAGPATGLGLGSLGSILAGAGALANVGMGAWNLAQGNVGKGVGTLAGTGVGAGAGAAIGSIVPGVGTLAGALLGAGLGGGAGGLLGNLFGKQEIPHAIREALELKRHAGQAGGFVSEIMGAQDFPSLYRALRAHQTGYVGGTSPQAVDISLKGAPAYLGLYQTATPWTQEKFFEEARRRPQDLYASVQAGVSKGLLDPMNIGIAKAVKSKLSELAFRQKATPFAVALTQKLGKGPAVTVDHILEAIRLGHNPNSPDFLQVMDRIRAAQAPTPPPPPTLPPPAETAAAPENPNAPGLPHDPFYLQGVQTLDQGGVVPRTGPFNLEKGEIVIPRAVAEALQPLPPQETEAISKPSGMHWYLNTRGGALFEAKANPDPASHWRVATSSREVREALDARDPVIAVAPDVVRMPMHQALPLIERARKLQWDQPGSGIELLGAMTRSAEPAIRLARHEQSETIQNDAGQWINVYGQATKRAGQPLRSKFPFERDVYGSVEEAVEAARKRSQNTPPHATEEED